MKVGGIWKDESYVCNRRAGKKRISFTWTARLQWKAIFDGRPMQMSGEKAIRSGSYRRSRQKDASEK